MHLDEMVLFSLDEILSESEGRQKGLVRKMCLRWPNEPALSICFALCLAASSLEDNFSEVHDGIVLARKTWTMAGLFAADVYAAECIWNRRALAIDITHFWRRMDPAAF